MGIFFSLSILEAAGDGVPFAKLFSETISLGSSIYFTTLTCLNSFATLILGALASVSIKQTT